MVGRLTFVVGVKLLSSASTVTASAVAAMGLPVSSAEVSALIMSSFFCAACAACAESVFPALHAHIRATDAAEIAIFFSFMSFALLILSRNARSGIIDGARVLYCNKRLRLIVVSSKSCVCFVYGFGACVEESFFFIVEVEFNDFFDTVATQDTGNAYAEIAFAVFSFEEG